MSDYQYIQVCENGEISDPRVLEFMDTVGNRDFLDFKDLQQISFMKFWKHMVIFHYEAGDFKYIFFGTNLVDTFGSEHTGKFVSEIPNLIRQNELYEVMQNVIATKQNVYAKGNLKIDEKEYRLWQRVIMPLQRKGEINEVLHFIVFNQDNEA
jgi:hypothetical protein